MYVGFLVQVVVHRVSSDSHDFISCFSTLDISILSCLCATYTIIDCVYVSYIDFDATVYLAIMIGLLHYKKKRFR